MEKNPFGVLQSLIKFDSTHHVVMWDLIYFSLIDRFEFLFQQNQDAKF